MAEEITFEEFRAKVKEAFAENNLALPEPELIELAHMEMLAEDIPMDEFIQDMVEESRG